MKRNISADQRAQSLLKRELGGGLDYDKIISLGGSGWTGFYMYFTVSHITCSTTAKHEVIIELARCDLEKGTKLERIVLDHCRCGPVKEVIEDLIGLENGETLKVKMTKIFDIEDKPTGANCLQTAYGLAAEFQLAASSNLQLGMRYTKMSISRSIDSAIIFLIKMGFENGVDMANVINKTRIDGQTLFQLSSIYSETVALYLVARNVKVNTIDDMFQTVLLKPSIIRYSLENGANPHVRNHADKTQYETFNLQLDSSFNSLPKSIYFTINGFTCRCLQSSCQNALLEAWHYSNGVLNGQFTRVVGRGGEGIVLEGTWCGQKAAFKFVVISISTFCNQIDDAMNELRRRLNESIQYSGTQSDLIVPFYGHYRQQLCYDDDENLAKLLGMKQGETIKYEVFVTKLCDGNLKDCKKKERLTSEHLHSIIEQLVDTLEELKKRGKCHNDVKPGNVLYIKNIDTNGQLEIRTKLADFGMCNQMGGTPGWSPPNFTHVRKPGYSDEYSFGLLALYLLVEDDELFYAIRDNYLPSVACPRWLLHFRDLPEIKIIRCMMDPSPHQSSKPYWAKLRSNIQMITRRRLASLNIHPRFLKLQDGNSVQDKNK